MANNSRKAYEKDGIIEQSKVGPYDVIRMMFNGDEAFLKLEDKTLSRNFYVVNDRLSIEFPLQAQVFNHYKIDGAQVIRCWREFIRRRGFTSAPRTLFVKGKKRTQEELDASGEGISIQRLRRYAWARNVSVCDLEAAIGLWGRKFIEEIEEWEKQQAEIEKLRSFKLEKEKNTDPEPQPVESDDLAFSDEEAMF